MAHLGIRGLGLGVGIALAISPTVQGQLLPDHTLGEERSRVVPLGVNIDAIEGA